MKMKNKILLSSVISTLAVSALITGSIFSQYKNYNQNSFSHVRFSSKRDNIKETVDQEKLIELPKDVVPEKPFDPEPPKEVVPEKPFDPEPPTKDPKINDNKKVIESEIETPEPRIELEKEFVEEEIPQFEPEAFIPFDSSQPRPVAVDPKNILPSEGSGERGGIGTYSRQKIGFGSGAAFVPGQQDSAITIEKLIRSGRKLKRISSDKPVDSEEFKNFEINSIEYTGDEIIKINQSDIDAALKVLNDNIRRYGKDEKEKNLLKTSLSDFELKQLRQGWFPVRMEGVWYFVQNSWELRPGFVNGTVYREVKKNMSRFLPFVSVPSRSTENVWNLEFKSIDSEETGSGWRKEILPIDKFNEKDVRLLKYTNFKDSKEHRYIIEVLQINNISDINLIIETAKKQMGSEINRGIGLALKGIKIQTQRNAAKIVETFSDFVKSLSLFYEMNNPVVLNSFIKNKNFSIAKPLEELNVYTRVPTGTSDSSTLSSADPRVFWKVKPSAHDNYSSINIKSWDVGNVNKATLEAILKNIYVTNRNRREYQGHNGLGGYVTELRLNRTRIYDLNNIDIPFANGREFVFTEVIFPEVKDKTLELDFAGFSIDNTHRIRKAYYGVDPSTWPEIVKINRLSHRGFNSDVATLKRILKYSTEEVIGLKPGVHFSTIDLSQTKITESQVRRADLPKFIKKVILKNNQTIIL